MQRITLVYNEDDMKLLERQEPEPPHRTGSATLVFHLAAREHVRHPDSVIELLNAEGINTGTVIARNPITYDHWWIPVSVLAAAGAPYAKALASVANAWLKGRRGRKVQLENGRSRITANSVADAERLLAAFTKHEKQLGLLQVAKARTKKKKAGAKRKKKAPTKGKKKR
jgi:hypothetical protein